MFWIGLIVGIIVAVLVIAGLCMLTLSQTLGFTSQKYWDMIDVVYDAAVNRESTLQAVHEGEVLSSVTLEER